MPDFSDAELVAFLDEALPPARASELETQLRDDAQLRDRLVTVRGRETAGLHTLGAIWRRSRLSCPSREDLGQYLLGTLEPDQDDYLRFHLETVQCRYCQANLDDLQTAASADQDQSEQRQNKRRKRYFQTSAGYLNRSE